MTVRDIEKLYNKKLDYVDIELIVAHSLGKTREFVLAHPDQAITKKQETIIKKLIKRRMKGEPIAYIVGHKEFYGLDFLVNKHTLIPRPETELIVETVIKEQETRSNKNKTHIIDIGTGSGNIIISIIKELEKDTRYEIRDTRYYATDLSKEALEIAQKNAKAHSVDKKIKFLHGNLLDQLVRDTRYEIRDTRLIIVANLPYLSKKIYASAPCDVKKYEPKSALYSSAAGLAHYKKLLKQIKEFSISYKLKAISCFFEISPEQKKPIENLIKKIFPKAKVFFEKDLAKKWRICKINLNF